MEALSAAELVFAALVLVVAYAVRGTAGFGGQALAVPLLMLVLPLPLVVASVVVLTALASVGHWLRDWGKIAWREIARLLPWSALGIFIGLYVLSAVDTRTLTRAFGVFIILYSLWALATVGRPLTISPRYLAVARALLTTLAGIAGAAFGAAAGPMYVMYFSALRMERDVFRVTITTVLAFQALMRIAGYAHLGLYNMDVLVLIAVGLPLMVLGSHLGGRLSGRLDPRTFERAVGALMLLSGAALLFK